MKEKKKGQKHQSETKSVPRNDINTSPDNEAAEGEAGYTEMPDSHVSPQCARLKKDGAV